jgi:DNA-binding MarR family transcriptional regulator
MAEHSKSLPMYLRGAYLAIHRQADALFSEFGLSADQFVVLTALAQGGEMSQRMLSDQIYSDPTTTSELLKRLELRLLIARKRDPADGRARIVSLTALGVKLQRQAYRSTERYRQEMADAFRPDELAQFKSFLSRLRNIVTRSNSDPTESVM